MLWACFWDAWGSLGVLWRSLEEPWGPLGVSWEVLGHPWRPSERPGIVLGGPWGDFGGMGRYGAILGSVLGGQNVDILLVLDGILRCHVF